MADEKKGTPPPPPPTQTPAESSEDSKIESQASEDAKRKNAKKEDDSREEAHRVIHGPEDSPLDSGPFRGVDPIYQTEPDPAD